MDRSYKIKLENWMTAKTVNKQLLISCLAAFDTRASQLAKTVEKYRYNSSYISISAFTEANAKLEELIEFRKPFLAVLHNNYELSLDEIKCLIATTLKESTLKKNIPTRQMIDQVQELLLSGYFHAA